jgi:long-chain acyl-CoA synthetase
VSIDFLKHVFQRNHERPAIVWNDQTVDYEWLLGRIAYWEDQLEAHRVEPATVVSLMGDFSPNSIALFLGLTERRCIIVPLVAAAPAARSSEMLDVAQVELSVVVDERDEVGWTRRPSGAGHELIDALRARGQPGLILFTSGSSGKPKAVVHDFSGLLEKFKTPRPSLRILNFLLFDHWGGLNTMLHTLSNGGTVITVRDRSPDAVCEAVERHRVEVLPVSPTFLNVLLLSKAHRRHDLRSLKVVSYGTEPMPPATLARARHAFPNVEFQQTYGLIELGVLRSRSKSSASLWVKLGGEGYQTRVVDGLLQIKADSAMLGYLNAPSPFTEDGWFMTGDAVEVEGEYLRILGRKSEIINVGGEKVYPQEVENVISEMDGIAEVTVYGEPNPIVGSIVCARVRLIHEEDPRVVARQVKNYCRERLQAAQVPVKVEVVQTNRHSHRFKKIRPTGQ